MKVKITVYVHHNQYSWQEAAEFFIHSFRMPDTEHRTYICEQEIEVDIPDNYDPTAQKIAALQKEKEQAKKEFAKKVANINERISKLQAIEYTA